MRTVVQDKYFLRDLHREIDLYDRKLIHLLKHEVFATEALRDTAVRKLATKRESLAATARTLVESGIEYHDNDLPRSFRPEGWAGAPQADTEASADDVAAAGVTLGAPVATSAFGTPGGKPAAAGPARRRIAPGNRTRLLAGRSGRLQEEAPEDRAGRSSLTLFLSVRALSSRSTAKGSASRLTPARTPAKAQSRSLHCVWNGGSRGLQAPETACKEQGL